MATNKADLELRRHIPPPTWGQNLMLVRKPRYRNASDLALVLNRFGLKASSAMISRIEDRTEPPDATNARQAAVATLVLCKTDPEVFGLSVDLLPRATYDAIVAHLSGPDDGGVADLGARRKARAIGESSSA